MEKLMIKNLVLFLIPVFGFCQKTDSVVIKINIQEYKKIAELNVRERYKYTKEKNDSLEIIYPTPDSRYLTYYNLNSLKVIPIPVFFLDENAVIIEQTFAR